MRWLRTPKSHMLLIFCALLGIAIPFSGGPNLWPKLAAAVLPACAIDFVWLSVPNRRPRFPESALLSALFVFSILSVQESWLVVAWTSTFAVLSKHILSTNREHIFNPAGLALVWAPIAFGSGESWWGAFGDMPWLWLVVLVGVGVWLTDRLNKFPLVLTFLAVYFTFFTVASVYAPHAVAEMFREPFVQAALFLAFFMLTDPPTSPNRYLDQVWFGVLAALTAGVAQLLGAGQVYLLMGVLVPNGVLAFVRWVRRQGAESTVRVRAAT
jgi:Na+-translocating ferredoxin:NAD+ oxidoreductase RnfD subunit